MVKYAISGSSIFKISRTDDAIVDTIPTGIYTASCSQQQGFFLEKSADFTLPPKIYGSVKERSERIIKTYMDRGENTGVLLAGNKGSGKSLLCRKVCKDLGEVGVPTVVVSTPFAGPDFATFLTDISQQCVVLFDEFEKVYDEEEQQQLLSLLDGLYQSNKLFLFTINHTHRINDMLIDRPSRIFYRFDYDNLEPEVIREIGNDTLQNKDHVDDLVVSSIALKGINFDMLNAIIEDMNRFDSTARESIGILNVRGKFVGSGTDIVGTVFRKMLDGSIVKVPSEMFSHMTPKAGDEYSFTMDDEHQLSDVSYVRFSDDIKTILMERKTVNGTGSKPMKNSPPKITPVAIGIDASQFPSIESSEEPTIAKDVSHLMKFLEGTNGDTTHYIKFAQDGTQFVDYDHAETKAGKLVLNSACGNWKIVLESQSKGSYWDRSSAF